MAIFVEQFSSSFISKNARGRSLFADENFYFYNKRFNLIHFQALCAAVHTFLGNLNSLFVSFWHD